MADSTPGHTAATNGNPPLARLDSWKEIATYLKRDVTTVRRWEKREGLPVHRHVHERRDSVYAYVPELDAWWESRRQGIQNSADDQDSPDGAATIAASRLRSQPDRWAWGLAVTFFATTTVLGILLVSRTTSATNDPEVERRFLVPPPAGTSFESVIVSPDGRHLAFTAAPNQPASKTKLFVQPLNSLQARELPDTDNASLPFWSPTSDALGFFAEGHLWTVAIAGGSPRSIAVATQSGGGTWNRDGTILFASEFRGALFRVPAGGGTTTSVTTLAPGEGGHVWPEFLADGKHFVYVSHPGRHDPEGYSAYVAALDGTWRRRILTTESGLVHSADGYLYFIRKGQLLAQPYDLEKQEIRTEPLALASRVAEHLRIPLKSEFSVSAKGVLTYRTRQNPATRLVWRDRAGRVSPFIATPAEYTEPTFSPDETRVAYDVFDPNPSERFGYGPSRVRGNIVVFDRVKGVSFPLTANPAGAWAPVWSPDGRSIVFSSHRGADRLELVIGDPADPAAAERPLKTTGSLPVATSWSPDGRFILYVSFDPKTRTDIWLLPIAGDRTPIPVIRSEFAEYQAQISPDGRWLAYASDESGRAEVYVQSFPTPATKRRVSTTGGADPRWRRDGKELYYVAEDRHLMAVPLNLEGGFRHGEAVALFDTGMPPYWYEARNLYDVSRDGRFLFMSPVEDDRSAPVTVVLNPPLR